MLGDVAWSGNGRSSRAALDQFVWGYSFPPSTPSRTRGACVVACVYFVSRWAAAAVVGGWVERICVRGTEHVREVDLS